MPLLKFISSRASSPNNYNSSLQLYYLSGTTKTKSWIISIPAFDNYFSVWKIHNFVFHRTKEVWNYIKVSKSNFSWIISLLLYSLCVNCVFVFCVLCSYVIGLCDCVYLRLCHLLWSSVVQKEIQYAEDRESDNTMLGEEDLTQWTGGVSWMLPQLPSVGDLQKAPI